jgi:hypothetical protein
MEDFRQLGRWIELVGDRQQEFERLRRNAHARPQARLNLRRILFSMTVITAAAVGMVAWWVQ